MKITEIEIIPVKAKNGLVAFASFVIDNSIYFSSVAIMTKRNGEYRLLYPTKKLEDKNISIYYPINKSVGYEIEKAIITKYEDVMKDNSNDRYGSFRS